MHVPFDIDVNTTVFIDFLKVVDRIRKHLVEVTQSESHRLLVLHRLGIPYYIISIHLRNIYFFIFGMCVFHGGCLSHFLSIQSFTWKNLLYRDLHFRPGCCSKKTYEHCQ